MFCIQNLFSFGHKRICILSLRNLANKGLVNLRNFVYASIQKSNLRITFSGFYQKLYISNIRKIEIRQSSTNLHVRNETVVSFKIFYVWFFVFEPISCSRMI